MVCNFHVFPLPLMAIEVINLAVVPLVSGSNQTPGIRVPTPQQEAPVVKCITECHPVVNFKGFTSNEISNTSGNTVRTATWLLLVSSTPFLSMVNSDTGNVAGALVVGAFVGSGSTTGEYN